MVRFTVPAGLTRIWSRRWARRLTYLLASGATLAGLAGFLVTRPSVDRWIVARLDGYLRAETGLAFSAERLEVHPFQGRLAFHHWSLGGDLVRADLLEVQLELGSLLRLPRLIHIRQLRLEHPTLVLDRQRLAQLKLKAHPDSSEPLNWQVDQVEIRQGAAQVGEPAWNLPPGHYTFQATGRGYLPKQLWLQFQVPTMTVAEGRQQLHGQLDLTCFLTDRKADLQKGELRLGQNHLTLHGSYHFEGKTLEAGAEGHLDLPELLPLALPAPVPPVRGQVAFHGQLSGPVDHLRWQGELTGTGLEAKPLLPLQPGTLHLALAGAPNRLHLEDLGWKSQDGTLTAKGEWNQRTGTRLELVAEAAHLAPVAGYTRTDFLRDLVVRFRGEASLPGAPWAKPRLDQVKLQGNGQFLEAGEPVGGLTLTVANSRCQLTALDLDLPQAQLHATAAAALGRHGLDSLQAEADIRTDAANVAAALQVWDIGSRDAAGEVHGFDMEGQAHTSASFHWSRGEGIQLRGHADILKPRWHGARADKVAADVSIDRDVLRVSDIQLEKDAGQGWGDLWLTWAPLPAGAETLDMCYRFSRLPVHEGLKAADQGELPITGTGSGWVRLHGPYQRIFMEGRALAENAEAYGFQLPAVASDFSMDIASLRLKTDDTRVATSVEQLACASPAPTGPLALVGSMDMDIPRERWHVALAGAVDSQALGLPGPHLQAQVEGHLTGAIVEPFGPYQMPTGAIAFSQGRVAQGDQSLEGLEGQASFSDGRLYIESGLAGSTQRLLSLEALQVGPKRLSGGLRLNVSQDSANTRKLAQEFSQDFLKDARLDYRAQGSWGPEGLNFKGSLEQFTGDFNGFQLTQAAPGRINGDASGLSLDLQLQGLATALTPGAVAEVPAAATRLGLTGWMPFSGEGPLALHLNGAAEVASLKTILDHLVQPGQYSLLADMHPGGSARVDLNLGGTLNEAQLDGTLTVQNGRVSVRTYPQSIENVDFTAHFKGRDITIPEATPLRGTLAQGALKAWGRVSWQLGGLSDYDLRASLEDFQFRDIPEGFELQGSLDATLKGNDQDGGHLDGSVWAKRLLYRADINLQDLILANALGATPGLNSLDVSDPLAHIDLKLDLHLAEPWEIDTNFLKLQGRPRGSFWIRGTLAQPGIAGQMDFLPGGRITNLLPAGDIVLERGSVVFKDPTVFNPNIDIMGRIDVPPYLVNLGITGTLDSIRATPSSTPSLRQDEIIAILIDPDSASTVGSTPSFSSQASMNTGLASTGTGLLSSLALANFQEGLRKTLNLDRVSVAFRSGVGATETQVTLGKSINFGGYRVPLVFTHRKAGDTATTSGQFEWRFGDFVLQLGFSQSTGNLLNPSGEIRHSWSPK